MIKPAAMNFIARVMRPWINLSEMKRAQSITKRNAVAGIAWLREKDKFAVMYLPRLVDDETDPLYLGTISNKASTVRPKTVSKRVLSNVLVPVIQESVPTDIPVGTELDKTNVLIKHFFHDKDGKLLDDKKKVIARLNCGIPVPNKAQLQTGLVCQGVYSGLDDIDDPFLSFWLENLNQHDPELQKLLLKEDTLKTFLPNKPATGHNYINSPFLKYADPDEDDTEMEEEVVTLSEDCHDITVSDKNDQIEKELSLFSPRRGSNTSPYRRTSRGLIDREIDTSDMYNTEQTERLTVTEKAQYNAKIQALGAIFDAATGKVTLPELSQFVESVRDHTSKTTQREETSKALTSIEDAVSDQDHYLARSVDMPKLDKVSAAFVAQGIFSDETIQSLEINSGVGVVLPMFMPDSVTTAESKAKSAGKSEAENVLGEHESRKTKLSTTFTSTQELSDLATLLSTLGNLMVLFHFYYKFRFTSLSESPSVVYYIIQLANMITTKEARKWFKHNESTSPQLLHYILAQVIAIVTTFAKASRDVLVTNAIMRNELDVISIRHYSLANNIFDDAKSTLSRVFLNSVAIPLSSLWTNSRAKKKIDEMEQRLLMSRIQSASSGLATKRTPDDQGRKPDDRNKLARSGENAGWIRCDGPNLSLPTELFNKDYKLCKTNARDGTVCQLGDRCKKDHSPLVRLDKVKQKAVVTSVDADDKLSFVNVSEKLLAEIRGR